MVRRYQDAHRRRRASTSPRCWTCIQPVRLLGGATSEHPDAGLACDAMRDGHHGARRACRHGWCDLRAPIARSTYTATRLHQTVPKAQEYRDRWAGSVRVSITLLRRRFFFDPRARGTCPGATSPPKLQARQVVVAWCQDFYHSRRRHSSAAIDVAHPIRETCCGPTGRSVRGTFTIRGEARPAVRCC